MPQSEGLADASSTPSSARREPPGHFPEQVRRKLLKDRGPLLTTTSHQIAAPGSRTPRRRKGGFAQSLNFVLRKTVAAAEELTG